MNQILSMVKTKAGSAYSQLENSYEAGVDIANKAIGAQQLNAHTLFLLFATPHHRVEELMQGIRSVLGDSPVFLGCSTTGIVTNDFLAYNGALAGGAFLSCDDSFFNLCTEEDIRNREYEAGQNLAIKVREMSQDPDASLLMFYDSVKTSGGEGQPELNLATPILDGFYAVHKNWPTFAGMGAMGEINLMDPCAAWGGEKIARHLVSMITIGGYIHMDTIIMHGTRPMSGYHTITKAEKNIVYELDGKPALDVIDEILGGSVPWEEFPLLVTLGVNNGDKFAEFDEENYASRLCLAIDRKQKGLIMFETDLQVGSEVQLMQRNIDFRYIQPQVNKLLDRIGNRKPLLALYIDCLGRVCGFSGLPEEESLEVLRCLGDLPFFGVFSGVEIANVGPKVMALDWTGVLCIFSEK